MTSEIIIFAILTYLTLCFFYFNIPYNTGLEMREVVGNGIYRALYTFISYIGWYIYWLIEKINKFIDKIFRIKEGGTLHILINAILYTIIVYLSSKIYDYLSYTIVEVGEANINLGSSDSYSMLSNAILLIKIIENFSTTESTLGFFEALQYSIESFIILVGYTIFHFSIIYGLLSQKMKQINIIEKLIHADENNNFDRSYINRFSLRNLFHRVTDTVLEFINNIAFLRNFNNVRVQFILCIIGVLYGMKEVSLGKSPDLLGFFLQFLDASGVITILGSFVVSFILTKLVALALLLLLDILPAAIKQFVNLLSDRGNAFVENCDRRRTAWAQQNDSIFQMTDNQGVRRMNLFE